MKTYLDLASESYSRAIAQSGLFEYEIALGVFQYSVQQTCLLQENQKHKAYVTMVRFCPCCLEILARQCLLDTGLEHSGPTSFSKFIVIFS